MAATNRNAGTLQIDSPSRYMHVILFKISIYNISREVNVHFCDHTRK